MSWALREWHLIKGHALSEGIITTRPEGPASLLDLSGDHFLTYLEVLARRYFGNEEIDNLYALNAPPEPFVPSPDRARQIRELEAMFAAG